jgi:hypothetical protein
MLKAAITLLFFEIGTAKPFTCFSGRNVDAKDSSLILLYKSYLFTFGDIFGTSDNFREAFH